KKKSPLYQERDAFKREAFLKALAHHLPEKCVYVDESGIDKFISREHGGSVRGQRIIGEASGRRYARESFIAGLVNHQVIAPLCYTGTCDAILFNFWLENFLLPSLGAGYTVIMDNAVLHKSEHTKFLIENAQCHLLFLPPYSPDLNPIETFWANLKTKIKKIIAECGSLAEAFDYAFQSIV
nr:IS630 family transposase [Gammaproteobacteria bacterium]